MPCYSCSSEFGLFKKEVGCEVCGFAFCSKCCKKHEVTTQAEQSCKKIVCNKCYNSLTSKSEMSKMSPPMAHKKRMTQLKMRSVSVDSGGHWSNEKDKEIAERLQKLKRNSIKDTVPSEDEIAERLAILKDIDPAKFKSPPIEVYRPTTMRSVVEQATSLMKQMAVEAELDSRLVKPEDEIAARLARLRGEKPPVKETDQVAEINLSGFQSNTSPDEEMSIDDAHSEFDEQSHSLFAASSQELKELLSNEEYRKMMQNICKDRERNQSDKEEEDEADKIVEELLAADQLDCVEGLDSLNDDTEELNSKSEKDTTEEFPWCIMCTEDAKIRCFGCDSDLYCIRCFKECHDSVDIKDHKTCPFLPSGNPVM